MKRYWIFMWEGREPHGGMYDFFTSDDNPHPAASILNMELRECDTGKGHVFDSRTGAIVYTADRRYNPLNDRYETTGLFVHNMEVKDHPRIARRKQNDEDIQQGLAEHHDHTERMKHKHGE